MKKILIAVATAAVLFCVYRFAIHRDPHSAAPMPPAAEEKPTSAENPVLVTAIQGSLGGAAGKARVDELLTQGADPNSVDTGGRPALALAARNNDLPAMESLLAKGADPNKRDSEHWTPLMTAAFEAARDPKFIPAVKLLLAKGADPNLEKDGTTALHVAVNNIDAKAAAAPVLEVLLAGGAKPDGVPASGPAAFAMRPLMLAAWNGKTAAAMALVKGGASLAAPSKGAKTPAQTARDNKHPELAALLEHAGKPAAAAAPPAPAKKPQKSPKRHR
ncbi:MAG: ankyrin repeat domain-containing protein [Bdellovibrionota bacterium]